MLGLLGSWKVKLAILGIVAALSAFGGWKGRDVLCDAAVVRAQLAVEVARTRALQGQIDTLRADSEALVRDNEALEEYNRRAKDAVDKIDAGECFSSTDVDSLRALWDRSDSTTPARPK